ncbi:hypothetical protein [Gracilibacillus phocaeensis]|uniref:hypothetical protein n=1 Tax=Gracilibacillus phocaeensis TaxID=2042304 RepID=UPI001030A9D7|nr:hypothetical protein [Gracilibacillus phocaeensis]
MINIMIVLSIVIASFGLGRYITFSSKEGKDERGESILAKSSHITVGLLFLIYAIFILIISFSNISAEVLGLMVVIGLSALILINGLAIMYFRKKI